MVAYMIATMTVHDPETLRKYTTRTPPIVKRHGGRYLTRGNAVETPEGETFVERMVILEFPSKADAYALLNDPEYVEAAKFRQAATRSRMIIQDGIENNYDPDPNV